ncbi:ribonuclease P protein subunit p25-like protein [Condylostylus longicornis]|uniref:ribonuclease P protein subunit p25-like protein n=1 Tax=Condylostylus longicornis TaxID=2530218 RepID=UPI00244DAF7A|nr:ribonuclease P protein subunit p25-like protein [Condylostylus longicornis]
MINYRKGENVEEELTRDNIPIECLPQKFLWMHVKGSTKISNVIEYAKKALDSGEYRSIVWTGSGGGIGKTISSAEIMKRDYDLHQVTRLCYQKIEEYWDPITKGLEQIVASRQIPCIHILTTLDEIDPKVLGYQKAKQKTHFWNDPNQKQKKNPNYHDQIKAKYNRNGEDRQNRKKKHKNKDSNSKQGEQSNKNISNQKSKSEGKEKFHEDKIESKKHEQD